MKMGHEQHLQNPEFMPPQPVSNMSDMAPNDTFKQDLLQTAMELDQNNQDSQIMMQQHHHPDQLMMQQQQQLQPSLLNQEQILMHQHQEQLMIQQQQNQEQLMLQQQQTQEQLMMQQQQTQEQLMMQQQQSIEESMEMSAPVTQDIHDDLAISDSDDEDGKAHHPPPLAIRTQEDEMESGLWF